MPGPKDETKIIDGTTYRVTQLVSKPARKLLVRLFNALGPTVGAFIPEGKLSLKNLFNGEINLRDGISRLSQDLTESELEHLIEVLCSNKTIACESEGGKWPILDAAQFDLHFTGRTMTMFKVLAFAIQVNYSDFLDAARAATAPIARPEAKDSSP